METRVSKLEQQMVDHLAVCEKRHETLAFQFRCVRKQLAQIDRKFDARSWLVTKWMLVSLVSIVLTMGGWIWIDTIGQIREGKNDVPSSETTHQPRVYPLLRE